MPAYYNEIDPYCAKWLHNLIKEGLIAPGDVDERDIREVKPEDLVGYSQCHFFAGIGVWSYALRLAGWPDDRPVWTGSCPCQPFSAAGKREGFADERHLWPAWFHLVSLCRPPVVFGEQVASQDGLRWLDLVQTDLEGADYAVGAADLCAAGVGAPHIRQRLWFVAHAGHALGERKPNQQRSGGESKAGRHKKTVLNQRCGPVDLLGNSSGKRLQERKRDSGVSPAAPESGKNLVLGGASLYLSAPLAHTPISGFGAGLCDPGPVKFRGSIPPDDSGSFWSDADWLWCRDGKWRPTASQYGPTIAPLQPLVDGSAFRVGSGSPLEGKSRVGMLRAAGNAIVPQVAAIFIKAAMKAIGV